MRAMVLPGNSYDWEGDKPLRQSPEKEIIYELHVGGFTSHSSAEVTHPGTFSGIIEKVPYLQDLGVTAVELLPIMAFDEQDLPDKARDLGLKNYWGYATHSFFSPHPGYCVNPLSGSHPDEFRDKYVQNSSNLSFSTGDYVSILFSDSNRTECKIIGTGKKVSSIENIPIVRV